MMIEKDDVGLSLSLSFPDSRNGSLQLNRMPSLVSSSVPSFSPFNLFQKTSWNQTFPSSDRNLETFRVETRPFVKGIDVNQFPSTADEEDELGASSPNSTVSSGSGKRSERDGTGGDDNEIERASSRSISDEEDGDGSRKKLRLSKDQSVVLEESFKEHNTLNPKQKLDLARRLGLRTRQVEVWFQNRRARTKLKQTEVDCEFLKRCCDKLTNENRRLQKEVQELRALKLSPQFYMQMTPPTTLNMCPSCERIAAPPSSTPTTTTTTAPLPRQTGPLHPRPVTFNPWAPTLPLSSGHSMLSILDRSR